MAYLNFMRSMGHSNNTQQPVVAYANAALKKNCSSQKAMHLLFYQILLVKYLFRRTPESSSIFFHFHPLHTLSNFERRLFYHKDFY